MAGAALATIIGQIVSGIMVIIYLTRFKTVHLTFDYLRPFLPTLKRSYPWEWHPSLTRLQWWWYRLLWIMYFAITADSLITAVRFLLPVPGSISKDETMIFFSLVIGLSQGLQPIVSFNYGAGKYRRVRSAYLKAVCIATCISSVSFLCFQLIPRQIISIFGSGSEEYFRFAEQYFRIFLFFTFLNGLQPLRPTILPPLERQVRVYLYPSHARLSSFCL